MLLTVSASAISAAATAGYAWLAGPFAKAVFSMTGDHGETLEAQRVTSLGKQTFGGLEDPWLACLLALLGVGFVRAVAEVVRAYCGTRFQQSVVRGLRGRLLGALLSAPVADLAHVPPGELASRVQVEIHGVRSLLHWGVTGLLGSVLVAASLATLALSVDSQLATLGLLALPVGVVVLVALGIPTRRLQRGLFEAESALVGASAAAIEGTEVLQSFQVEPAILAGTDRLAQRASRRATATQAWASMTGPAAELSAALGVALALGWAIARDGRFDVGSTAVVIAALVLMFRPLRTLGGSMMGVWAGLACLDRLDELWAMTGDPVRGPSGERALPGSVDWPVSLRGVSVGYQRRSDPPGDGVQTPVLEEVNLTLRPGELVALVGESGAGKTSLLRVLAGLMKPTDGEIVDRGHRAFSETMLRRIATWMPQQTWLTEGTVADNVALGQRDIDEARMTTALIDAGAQAVVASLGQGWASPVSRDGKNLSEGQRQRLCIARSLYRGTPMMLFDEPTSALDEQHERVVVETLRELAAQGHLVLVATHRQSVIEQADRVLRVRGRGVQEWESETHAPLLH